MSASLDRGLDGFHRPDFLRGLDDARLARIQVVERGLHLRNDLEWHHHGAVLVSVDQVAAAHPHAVHRQRESRNLPHA